MSFMHSGKYVCKCGREFDNSQSFNGHKSHCKVLLTEKGTYEEYLSRQSKSTSLARSSSSKKRSEQSNAKRLSEKLMWESTTHYCEKCGKELPHNYEDRYTTGRFCSKSCAHSREHSEESRKKVSLALRGKNVHNRKLVLVEHEKKFCKTCGKELKWNNKSGYCIDCIKSAPDRHELRVEVGKRVAQKAKESGNAKYWQTRNIESYPERFWKDVLSNNSIPYSGPNVPIKKADDKNVYFLDFYIERGSHKVDLEIDGKQHRYPDRVESDKIRDEYLTSLGYEVYRIPWNEIVSEKESANMKQKIDRFLEFYNSL